MSLLKELEKMRGRYLCGPEGVEEEDEAEELGRVVSYIHFNNTFLILKEGGVNLDEVSSKCERWFGR